MKYLLYVAGFAVVGMFLLKYIFPVCSFPVCTEQFGVGCDPAGVPWQNWWGSAAGRLMLQWGRNQL